jgi:hypothetical protein
LSLIARFVDGFVHAVDSRIGTPLLCPVDNFEGAVTAAEFGDSNLSADAMFEGVEVGDNAIVRLGILRFAWVLKRCRSARRTWLSSWDCRVLVF